MKALIIEDNKPLAESLRELLEKEGIEAQARRSWAEAAPLTQEDSFDFYLIDVFLPGKQGLEILEEISQGGGAGFKAVLMSGFFSESAIFKKIPEALRPSCIFMKKPLDEEKLLEQLKNWSRQAEENKKTEEKKSYSKSFNLNMSKSLESYLSGRETLDSQELPAILFLANYSRFSGVLECLSKDGEKTSIEFFDGGITKILSQNKPSYFGSLLVEHGLLLEEDIQSLLDGKTAPGELIGQTLVEKKLLSPYMLNVILKEQIKIRLSQLISQKAFSVKAAKAPPEAKSQPADQLLFDKADIMEWSADSIRTQLSDLFLESFFLSNRQSLFQKNSPLAGRFAGNKKFLDEYNGFFQTIGGLASFESLSKAAENKKRAWGMVYFGILTKSLEFIQPKKPEMNSASELELFVDRILSAAEDSPYKILNLPWQSSLKEVESGYRKIVKIIHPDHLSSEFSEKAKDKCAKAFHKVSGAYQLLSNKDKKEEWLKSREEQTFLNVMSVYEEGIRAVKKGRHSEGLELLESIEKNDQAPENTALYLIWAKIKSHPDLTGDRRAAGEIMRRISACPIDQRISPLFWFVSGLSYYATEQYEKAQSLFKKTLKIQKDFTEAKKSLMLTEKKLMARRKKPAPGFLGLFSKK